MKKNFKISQLNDKVFGLDTEALQKEWSENFKKNNGFFSVAIIWLGLVLFSLVWSFILYGLIIAALLFLGVFQTFEINFNFLYVYAIYPFFFLVFLLVTTTQQLQIEYARFYQRGLLRGLISYKENFQWAKENLNAKEFNYLIEQEFKYEKNLYRDSNVIKIEKKSFIDNFKNPSDLWISSEQFIFFVIAGLSIYFFWDTDWRWATLITSVVIFVILLAIRDNPNQRN